MCRPNLNEPLWMSARDTPPRLKASDSPALMPLVVGLRSGWKLKSTAQFRPAGWQVRVTARGVQHARALCAIRGIAAQRRITRNARETVRVRSHAAFGGVFAAQA